MGKCKSIILYGQEIPDMVGRDNYILCYHNGIISINKLNTMKTTINTLDVELDIEYEISGYDDPGNYLNPPSSEYVNILDVSHKGESIYDLIAPKLTDIEELTAKTHWER
jgi:hypothetical protein